MKPLRVCLITTSFPTDSNPTSGIFIKNLYDSLPENIKKSVLTPSHKRSENEKRKKKENVYAFRYAPNSMEILAHSNGGIPVSLKQNKMNYALVPFFLASLLLYAIIHGAKNDVLHANWSIAGVLAGLAGALTRCSVITTIRGEDLTRCDNSPIYRFILGLCILLNKKIVCVSSSMQEQLKNRYSKHAQKIEYIPNGIDSYFYKIEQPRNKVPKLLTVGSLITRKNIICILRAMTKIKEKHDIDLFLTIIGDGNQKEELKEYCKFNKIEDNVFFPGQIPHEAIHKHYATHDIFILSSLSEGRPNVIIEAMAAGLIPVASKIPGCEELIVDNVNGFLFPPDDHETLALILLQLISYEETLLAEISASARKHISTIVPSWSESALSYEQLYMKIL